MAVDTTKIRAYTSGLVAVSGYGVSNPTLPVGDPSVALNAAIYKELGALTDEGITESTSQEYNDIFMWQGNALAASLPGKYSKTFTFAALETNAVSLGLTFAGSTLTSTAYGVSIAEKPPARDIRAWVLHGIDGTRLQRIVVPLGQLTERGDAVWSSQDATAYEYTVKCFVDASGNVAYRYYGDVALTL
jgi:hypothetical protein